MKHLFYCVLSFCAFLSWSCNQDNEVVDTIADSAEDVCFVVPEFEPEDGSRVNVNVTTSGASFVWSAGDKIGTFSREGGLLRFDIKNSDVNSNEAHFQGAGYTLSPFAEYCAFYPFADASATVTKVNATFSGQKQVGNDNTNHIGAYDYIFSPFQATNARGEVMFQMKHLASLVRFKLVMPVADNFTKMTLHGHYGCRFPHTSSFNPSETTPTLGFSNLNTTFDVDLEGISTSADNEEITVYVMMVPYDYTGQWWRIEVTGDHGTYITSMENGRNFEAGKIHAVNRTLH